MAATALIKFTQGLVVGADGQALRGVVDVAVHVSNVNNADVMSWQVDLVYVDPRSSLAAATPYATGNNATPTATFVPDAPGSYRVVLKVWENSSRSGDPVSTDIRVFGISEDKGLLVPPAQVWPLPLPDSRSGLVSARPNEMNFYGQEQGWAGVGSDGLLHDALHALDGLLPPVVLTELYVDGGWVGESDGTRHRPFRTIQGALDVINNDASSQVSWRIYLAAGDHTNDTTLTLNPAHPKACLRVAFVGAGSTLTSVGATSLSVSLPTTAWSAVVFAGLQSSMQLSLLEQAPVVSAPTVYLELKHASLGVIQGNWLSVTDLQVRVEGTNLSEVSLTTAISYATASVAEIACTAVNCDVYMCGARVLSRVNVSGTATFKDVDFVNVTDVTARQISLRNSGFRANSTVDVGHLNTNGAPNEIGFDTASFARVLRFNTRFDNASTKILALDGGEFAYSYPQVHTTTDGADQPLFQQELGYLPANTLIGVRAVVTAYNPAAVAADCGAFQRHALVLSSGVLVKEGEAVFTDGLTVGMSSVHSIRYDAAATYVRLLCTPQATTSDHNVYWNMNVYYTLSKAI